MRTAVALLLALLCARGALAKGDAAPAAKPVAVVRDLSLLAAGKYAMVQAWDLKGTETLERRGAEPEKRPLDSSNRLTFSVVVSPAAAGGEKEITVEVARLVMQMRSDSERDKVLVFDSAGPAEKQAEILYRQFHALAGKKTQAGALAFSDGAGFIGLDDVWAAFGKEHPEMSRAAQSNLKNWGDARVDRMFTQGLDVLYGQDAGRAKGKTRELHSGDVFSATLERPGIAMKPTAVEHECRVVSADRGEVTLRVEWKINGFDPQSTDDGGLVMRGGDIHGVATLTFLAQGGLLTRLDETVERTDQQAPGPQAGVSQWTRRATEKKTFSFGKP